MGKVKKKFVEFKSIFFSKDVLKENETHANIVVATTMFNLFLVCIITFLLVYFKVFKIGTSTMTSVLIANAILLGIPAIFCLIVKGNNKWMRIMLFICFVFAMAISDAVLKYNVTLLMVLPLILAARYYNKEFTIWVAIFTFLAFVASTYFSVNYGQQDLNTYNLIIPNGTTLTINTTLRDAVTKVNVNEAERIRNIFVHFFMPKLFVYSIISFACIQIAQSGKKMIEKQIEITDKTSRLNTELDLAYNIQKSMLPSTFPAFPDHDEIDIYAISIPAKEVGGDFYDMFLVDDNHVAICMADVSGKGVPSALFMMVSKILIKVITDEGGNVNDVITRVNGILSEDNALGLFVTAWFGVLDLRTGIIEFVNAGHNPPLVYSTKTGKHEFLRTKANFVIGGMKGTQYQKLEYKLEQGDRLFLYTDGVVEAVNKENEQYGERRLRRFLDENTDLTVKDIIDNLREDINKFSQEAIQFDDISMLELQYGENPIALRDVKREFDADLNELSNVQNFVNEKLINNDVDEKTINQIDLAVEEIFVNIVKYAYNDKNGKCFITMKNNDNTIEFIFEDNGIPFNPLEKTPPDISLPKEKRKIGGLGIYLVGKTMDEVNYKYENNKNILKIVKKIK